MDLYFATNGLCHKAKQIMEPFPFSDHKSEKLGELVDLDLWCPYRVTGRKGSSIS